MGYVSRSNARSSLIVSPDVSTVYNSVQPMAYIYELAFGRTGSLIVWSFMCVARTYSPTNNCYKIAERQKSL